MIERPKGLNQNRDSEGASKNKPLEVEAEQVTDPDELRDIYKSKKEADRKDAWSKIKKQYDMPEPEPIKADPHSADKYLYGFSSLSEGIEQLTKDTKESIEKLRKTLSEVRRDNSHIPEGEIIEEYSADHANQELSIEDWTDEDVLARRILIDNDFSSMSLDKKLDFIQSLKDKKQIASLFGADKEEFFLYENKDLDRLAKIVEMEVGKEERGEYNELKINYDRKLQEVFEKDRSGYDDLRKKSLNLTVDWLLGRVINKEISLPDLESLGVGFEDSQEGVILGEEMPENIKEAYNEMLEKYNQTIFTASVFDSFTEIKNNPKSWWVVFKIGRERSVKLNQEEYYEEVVRLIKERLN